MLNSNACDFDPVEEFASSRGDVSYATSADGNDDDNGIRYRELFWLEELALVKAKGNLPLPPTMI
jgi:hypothetical protein